MTYIALNWGSILDVILRLIIELRGTECRLRHLEGNHELLLNVFAGRLEVVYELVLAIDQGFYFTLCVGKVCPSLYKRAN